MKLASTFLRTRKEGVGGVNAEFAEDDVDPEQTNAILQELGDVHRPATRGECPASRPCPFVSCRYNLYLDVSSDGRIFKNFRDHEVWDLGASNCALDYAELGGMTYLDVSRRMGISRNRITELETRAIDKMKSAIEKDSDLGSDLFVALNSAKKTS